MYKKISASPATPAALPPRFDEVQAYFSQKGMSSQEAHHFYFVNNVRGWRNRKGSPIQLWKAAAYEWITDAWEMNPFLFDRLIF